MPLTRPRSFLLFSHLFSHCAARVREPRNLYHVGIFARFQAMVLDFLRADGFTFLTLFSYLLLQSSHCCGYLSDVLVMYERVFAFVDLLKVADFFASCS